MPLDFPSPCTNATGGSSILEKPVPVAAGDYVYPFSFRVPALALPPSYEGIYGVTRYEVGAVLVRPGHANRSTNLILTVPSTLDSDADIYNNPVENTVRKSVGKVHPVAALSRPIHLAALELRTRGCTCEYPTTGVQQRGNDPADHKHSQPV